MLLDQAIPELLDSEFPPFGLLQVLGETELMPVSLPGFGLLPTELGTPTPGCLIEAHLRSTAFLLSQVVRHDCTIGGMNAEPATDRAESAASMGQNPEVKGTKNLAIMGLFLKSTGQARISVAHRRDAIPIK